MKIWPIAYHGTNSVQLASLKNGIDLKMCDTETDFGQGFYITNNFHQAKRWALRQSEAHNNSEITKNRLDSTYQPSLSQPVIVEYRLDLDKIYKLQCYIFDQPDDNWRNFVYNNRNNGNRSCCAQNNLDGKYDFVAGPMADGTKMSRIYLVRKGILAEDDFVNEITAKGTQLSLHTNRILNHISIEGVIFYEKC